MKHPLILISFLCFGFNVFGQQPEYPDSGFTNKDEAKNIKINGKKEGKWYEHVKWYSEPSSSHIPAAATDGNIDDWYTLTVYKHGIPYGIARRYDLKSTLERESPYLNGKRNGTEKQYYPSGKLFYVTKYRNDTILDTVNGYWEDGKLLDRVIYVNGKRNGVEKEYYDSGSLWSESPWVNDTLDGVCKEYYYKHSNLDYVCPYVKGQMDGAYIRYYENGMIEYESFHIKGKPVGTWKEYYEDGKIKSIRRYNNDGRFLGGEDYDVDGNQIKQ